MATRLLKVKSAYFGVSCWCRAFTHLRLRAFVWVFRVHESSCMLCVQPLRNAVSAGTCSISMQLASPQIAKPKTVIGNPVSQPQTAAGKPSTCMSLLYMRPYAQGIMHAAHTCLQEPVVCTHGLP